MAKRVKCNIPIVRNMHCFGHQNVCRYRWEFSYSSPTEMPAHNRFKVKITPLTHECQIKMIWLTGSIHLHWVLLDIFLIFLQQQMRVACSLFSFVLLFQELLNACITIDNIGNYLLHSF